VKKRERSIMSVEGKEGKERRDYEGRDDDIL
jgi:hypothetical protein